MGCGHWAVSVVRGPGGPCGPDEGEFFFKSDDRIVFLGDSITEQYQYSTDIELYLTTRFPKWNLTFLNAGIGGDTARRRRAASQRTCWPKSRPPSPSTSA